MTRSETPATPAPRELTSAEMRQAGGGSDSEWRYVPVRRLG
jgi:hypothetical protein